MVVRVVLRSGRIAIARATGALIYVWTQHRHDAF